MTRWTLHHADCLDAMRTMEAESVDAIVTDPPYGLSFMGKGWDHGVPGVEFWSEALRVAKPGAHLLAFGGTRTFHRLACAIEDAGWEIRDCLSWLYGSGFPKSLDVSKAIDKAAGALSHEGKSFRTDGGVGTASYHATIDSRFYVRPAPATDNAVAWHGWGTALKPAWEPVILARKPLDGTVAANVLAHGTGAINVDGCRVPYGDEAVDFDATQRQQLSEGAIKGAFGAAALIGKEIPTYKPGGRWPANVALDEEAAAMLDERTGTLTSGMMRPTHTTAQRSVYGQNVAGGYTTMQTYGDSGGASRFFYTAKASRSERGEGNTHPTVKPLALMRWLVRLVCPPGGLVLDPFSGSGSTGVAALAEGMRYVGCEREAEYVEISRRRLESSHAQMELL